MKTVEKYLYRAFYWMVNQYYWVKVFIFRGEFQKKHILIQRNGSQIKLVIKNHPEFVSEKQEAINAFKKKDNEKKLIRFALEQAIDGCNYVVFSKENNYVQFWTSGGKIRFDFPLNKLNKYRKYYYQVLGLLADNDFVRNTFAPSGLTFTDPAKYNKYKIDTNIALTTIEGYFGKMIDKATDFTELMFKEIYKSKKERLEIKVG